MLMIINNEAYMIDGIVNDMFAVYDSSCGDDIEDLKELYKSFSEVNKQKFNSLLSYSFSLFQNNLLKALKKSFDAKAALIGERSPIIEIPRQEIQFDLNETKDTFVTKEEENVVVDPADEYL